MIPRFVVIEGSDASGKKTQSELLVQKLISQDVPAKRIAFPIYDSPTGHIVTHYLNGEFGPPSSIDPKIASTWYALNRYEHKEDIHRWLISHTVVCDRYVESNMGHQGGKIASRQERADFFEWCERLEYGTLELPRPQVCVFLHVPWEVSYKVVKMRAIALGKELDGHEADKHHLIMAERAYEQLAEMPGWVAIECCDGELFRPIEEIAAEIYDTLYVKGL